MKRKVIHAVGGGGGEYPSESEFIYCDKKDSFQDPNGTFNWKEVTCKNCLRLINPKPKKPKPKDGKCCTCGYEGDGPEGADTPCPKSEDETHCEHYWNGPEEPGVEEGGT